jgi:hypothetical protein
MRAPRASTSPARLARLAFRVSRAGPPRSSPRRSPFILSLPFCSRCSVLCPVCLVSPYRARSASPTHQGSRTSSGSSSEPPLGRRRTDLLRSFVSDRPTNEGDKLTQRRFRRLYTAYSLTRIKCIINSSRTDSRRSADSIRSGTIFVVSSYTLSFFLRRRAARCTRTETLPFFEGQGGESEGHWGMANFDDDVADLEVVIAFVQKEYGYRIHLSMSHSQLVSPRFLR